MKNLRPISWDEALARGRQEANKFWDAARFRLRLPVPRPQEIDSSAIEAAHFFFSPSEIPELIHEFRNRFPEEVRQTIQRAERICRHEFDLLGYERLSLGAKINWHRDPVSGKSAPLKPWFRIRYLDYGEVGDAKVTWELNRHQHLVILAQAYLFTRDPGFAKELFEQWFDWQRENSYPIGINWTSSLEVAFRSLSWIWVWKLLSSSGVVPPNFTRELLTALNHSARHIEKYLSTYFSPNTHLLGEALALFFIGTLCPNLAHAQRWRQTGWRVILDSAQKQVRSDGMYFEQSTYYHVYALDMFLHARILASRNGIAIPTEFDRKIESMLDFLATLAQACAVPRLGDDDGGRLFDSSRNRAEHMLDPLASGAILFSRLEFKSVAKAPCPETLWLFGPEGLKTFDSMESAPVELRSTAFPESGIYVMADSLPEPAQLVVDAGPQGGLAAGHGHADALTIDFAANGRALLVDPGTFQYVSNGNSRNDFRGTAAHNTLCVDNADQSAPKSPFSWNGFAETEVESWIAGKNFELFHASHSGYSRLPSPVIHRRWIFHLRSRFWLIRDVAEGSGSHSLALRWHFAPHIEARALGSGSFLILDGGKSAMVLLSPQRGAWNCKSEAGEYSPVYGRKEAAPILTFRTETQLPAEFYSLVLPGSASADNPGQLTAGQPDSARPDLCLCSYQAGSMHHQMIFSDARRPWRVGQIESDAQFAYCSSDPDGHLLNAIACSGTFAKFASDPRIAIPDSTSHLEWPGGKIPPASSTDQPLSDFDFSGVSEEKLPVSSNLGKPEPSRGRS